MTSPDRRDDLDAEQELAWSLHRALAGLAKVRDGGGLLPRQQLAEKLELVVWLSGELRAAYGLLLGSCVDAGMPPEEVGALVGVSAEEIRRQHEAAVADRQPAAAATGDQAPAPSAGRPTVPSAAGAAEVPVIPGATVLPAAAAAPGVAGVPAGTREPGAGATPPAPDPPVAPAQSPLAAVTSPDSASTGR